MKIIYKWAYEYFLSFQIILFVSCVKCILALTVSFDKTFFNKCFEGIADGGFFDRRNKLFNITLCELADFGLDSLTYKFNSRKLFIENIDTLFKFTVSRKDDSKNVFDKITGIILKFNLLYAENRRIILKK